MRTPEQVAREAAHAPRVEPDCPTTLHPTTLTEVLPCPECDVIHAARVIAAYVEEVAAASPD